MGLHGDNKSIFFCTLSESCHGNHEGVNFGETMENYRVVMESIKFESRDYH